MHCISSSNKTVEQDYAVLQAHYHLRNVVLQHTIYPACSNYSQIHFVPYTLAQRINARYGFASGDKYLIEGLKI